MSLTTSLLHARSGLVGAQAGLDVVSRNIANATTEGYTKKIHNQANLIIGGTGSGLKVEEVTRKVTDTLQESLREQNGVIEKLEILDDFIGRLELEFGRPDDQSSISAKLTDLKKGTTDVVIGTHALFQADVVFKDLRFAVVDEQHRFGVNQRLELGNKGIVVDLLIMTATPIPRSLALALSLIHI